MVDPKLQALANDTNASLRDILMDAQSHVRQAEAVLASIPRALLSNGLGGSVSHIRLRLSEADSRFVTALQSIQHTYGDVPKEEQS